MLGVVPPRFQVLWATLWKDGFISLREDWLED